MFNNLRVHLETLSRREKLIVLATALTLLWSLWDQLCYQPINQRIATAKQNLTAAEDELNAQKRTLQALETTAHNDPNQQNQEKQARLQEELLHLKQQLDAGGKRFVPAQLMAFALRDVLQQNQQLKLINLTTLPAKTLTTATEQDQPVYIHGLSLTFSGSYSDTLTYLKSLEALPWHFKWESIDYQVKNYPLAEVTLKAHTLSFEESWLGI